MIKVYHSEKQMKRFADKHFALIEEKQRDYLSIFKVAFPKEKKLYDFLEINLKDIIIGDVKKLFEIKENIEKLLSAEKYQIDSLFSRSGITKEHITNGLINNAKYFSSTSYSDWNSGKCLDSNVRSLIAEINSYLIANPSLHVGTKEALESRKSKLTKIKSSFNANELGNIIKKQTGKWNEVIRSFTVVQKLDDYFKIYLKVEDYNKENKENEKKYTLFEYKSESSWRTELFFNLNINSCLYCNRQYIHYDEKAFGTTLDHFYDKGTYPYFALSFYNLIPSCYSCNSLLKKSKPFCSSTHLHPYEKSFENILHFSIDISEKNKMEEIIDWENIDFDIRLIGKSADDKELIKARKNDEDFFLEKQYQIHKSEVRRLLNLSLRYNDLETAFNSYGITPAPLMTTHSQELIFKTILGVFLDEDDLHKETLAKLKRDIIRQYHLSFKRLLP